MAGESLDVKIARIDERLLALLQRTEEFEEDVKSLRRSLYTFAFSAVIAALVFALAVFQLVG
jgi:hypothetical protein